MIKTALAIFAATAVMLMVSAMGFAETRGQPFTPEELYEQSTLVIKGAVLEIETIMEFQVSFPIGASVDAVVKGKWKEKKIAFQPKHPGLNVIFEQEYNKPEMGQKGTFYVQSRNGTLVLIGYISNVKPDHQAVELMPVPGLKAPAASDAKRVSEIREIGLDWWLKNRGVLAEESFKVVGYFFVARPIAKFANRNDRLWEVRVLHLHTGAPTGIMWINDKTEEVIALGVEEKEQNEPIAPANRT